MRKLSEVCRLVGVTRRTLQEYNRIGLVCPSKKTEGGYWLYDDEAVGKLELVQIFIEIGYDRQSIKSILESPDFDLMKECDLAIEALKKKKKHIEGMLKTINGIKSVTQIPEPVNRLMDGINTNDLFANISFNSILKHCIKNAADSSEPFPDFAGQDFVASIAFLTLAQLRAEDVTADIVQSRVSIIFEHFVSKVQEEIRPSESISKSEMAEFFVALSDEIHSNSEAVAEIDALCGKGAAAFINKAIHASPINTISHHNTKEELQ